MLCIVRESAFSVAKTGYNCDVILKQKKMNIEKLVKAVEEKTGETIVEVTVQKPNVLNKFLCKIGFHKWYVKSGEGHFCKNQCFNCGEYGLPR